MQESDEDQCHIYLEEVNLKDTTETWNKNNDFMNKIRKEVQDFIRDHKNFRFWETQDNNSD